MHLIVNQNKNAAVDSQGKNDGWHIHQLRQAGNVVRPDRVKTGNYYLYKEKHGMVCIVKILEETSIDDWVGFRMQVKRVLFSSWQVPKNYVFETGFQSGTSLPSSWHFEPVMVLLESQAG